MLIYYTIILLSSKIRLLIICCCYEIAGQLELELTANKVEAVIDILLSHTVSDVREELDSTYNIIIIENVDNSFLLLLIIMFILFTVKVSVCSVWITNKAFTRACDRDDISKLRSTSTTAYFRHGVSAAVSRGILRETFESKLNILFLLNYYYYHCYYLSLLNYTVGLLIHLVGLY